MDTTDAQQELARAIRSQLESAGRSQSWLGAEVANAEGRTDPYSQAVVSEWVSGQAEIPPGRLFIIERVLGRRPGTFSRIVGYLPVGARSAVSVAEAIDADPQLSLEGRVVVLGAYRAAVAHARSEART
jgi:hypothetical protein